MGGGGGGTLSGEVLSGRGRGGHCPSAGGVWSFSWGLEGAPGCQLPGAGSPAVARILLLAESGSNWLCAHVCMPVHVHVCVRVQWGGGSQKCVSSTCSAAYQLIFPSDPIFFLLSQSLPSFLPSLTLASSLLVTALLSSHPSCSLPHPSSRVKEVACRIQGLSLSACCHGDPEAGPRILGEGRSLKALRRRPGLSFRASEWPPCCQGSVWMTAEECGFWAGRQSAVPQGAWVQTLQTFLGLQEVGE